jgi:hypothetical protein
MTWRGIWRWLNCRCVECGQSARFAGLKKCADCQWAEWRREREARQYNMIARLDAWQKEQRDRQRTTPLVLTVALNAAEFERQMSALEVRWQRQGKRLTKIGKKLGKPK